MRSPNQNQVHFCAKPVGSVPAGRGRASVSGALAHSPSEYPHLLEAVKLRIRTAQVKATLSANREMILMYWDIGRMISERQKHQTKG